MKWRGRLSLPRRLRGRKCGDLAFSPVPSLQTLEPARSPLSARDVKQAPSLSLEGSRHLGASRCSQPALNASGSGQAPSNDGVRGVSCPCVSVSRTYCAFPHRHSFPLSSTDPPKWLHLDRGLKKGLGFRERYRIQTRAQSLSRPQDQKGQGSQTRASSLPGLLLSTERPHSGLPLSLNRKPGKTKVLVKADGMSHQEHEKMVHFSQDLKPKACRFPKQQEACFCVSPGVQPRGWGCCPHSAPHPLQASGARGSAFPPGITIRVVSAPRAGGPGNWGPRWGVAAATVADLGELLSLEEASVPVHLRGAAREHRCLQHTGGQALPPTCQDADKQVRQDVEFPLVGGREESLFCGAPPLCHYHAAKQPQNITTSSGTGIVRLIFQIRKQTQRT